MLKRALYAQQRLTGESLIKTLIKYFVFIFGGFLGWVVAIIIHLLLSRVFNVSISIGSFNIQVSYAIGLSVAVVLVFMYHRFLTFNVRSHAKRRFNMFVVAEVTLAVLNWIFFALAIKWFGELVPDFGTTISLLANNASFFAQTITINSDIQLSFVVTLILSVLNFWTNRLIVFRSH